MSQTNFTEHINTRMQELLRTKSHAVVFGQNVFAGSRISGLGKNLETIPGVKAMNTPNIENSLMATGMGLLLAGTSSIFIMKQHDFALLGLDQLTNTWNLVRAQDLTAYFVVLMVVVDTGLEGPQANLNNLDEFASLTRAPVYLLSTQENIDQAFLLASGPGLHFMAVGQSRLKSIVDSSESNASMGRTGTLIERSSKANNCVIVYFGLNIQLAEHLAMKLSRVHLNSDIFAVMELSNINALIADPRIENYQYLVIADSGKSMFSASAQYERLARIKYQKVAYVKRAPSISWSEVDDVEFEFSDLDVENILEILGESQ